MIEIDESVLEEMRILLHALESLCNTLPSEKRTGHLADRAWVLRRRIDRELERT